MTDTIASLQAIIGADVSGLQAGLNKSKGMLSDTMASFRQTGAALTAGLTGPIVAFGAAAVKAASDNQTALAQLDAVLKSTTSQNGTFTTGVAGSSKEIAKLTKEVDTAQAHLNDLTKKWDESKKHTQAQSDAITAASKKLSDLQNQLSAANQTTTVSNDVIHMNRQAYIDLSEAMAKTTRFSKDQVLSTEDLLLTFTSIGKDIFPDVTKATLDMSQALGQDTKSSAIQLGKALQDPVKGVTALKRVGVQFTQSQIDQIGVLVKSGKTLDAQRLILKEIQKEFGGSAQAAGQTFAGQMDILNHSFTDFQEKVGYIIIPVLEKFMTGISNIVDDLNRLNPNILQIGIVAAVAVAAIGPILGILGSIGAVIGFILSPIGLLVIAVGALAVAWQTDFGGIREKVMPILNEFVNFVKTVVLPGLQKFADWFIKDVLPAVGKAVKDFGDNILNPVIRILGDVWKVVSPELQKLGDWFLKNVWPQISIALTVFNIVVLQPLIRALSGIWDSVGPALKSFADWFDKNLPAIQLMVDNLLASINKIPTALTNVATSALGIKTSSTPGGSTSYSGGQSTVQAVTALESIQRLFGGFDSGGYTGDSSGVAGVVHGGEYVVPSGGALISKGGGSGVVHIELNADGFTQHIYARVAAGMAAGS